MIGTLPISLILVGGGLLALSFERLLRMRRLGRRHLYQVAALTAGFGAILTAGRCMTFDPSLGGAGSHLQWLALLGLPVALSVVIGRPTAPENRLRTAAIAGIGLLLAVSMGATPGLWGGAVGPYQTLSGSTVWMPSPGPLLALALLYAVMAPVVLTFEAIREERDPVLDLSLRRWLRPLVAVGTVVAFSAEALLMAGLPGEPLLPWMFLLFVLASEDITARRLKMYAERLEARVAERTAQLEAERRRLHDAVEAARLDREARESTVRELMASERMASLGMVAGGVAHEINNPLMMIGANLAFVQEQIPGPADPDVVDALEDAARGVDRIANTIRGFRRFTEAPAEGEFVIDLHDTVRRAARLVEAELRSRAEIVLDLGMVPLVRGNEGSLVHVLVSLMMAASADEHRSGVEIRLHTEAWDGGARLVIEHDGPPLGAEGSRVGSLDGEDGLRLSVSHALLGRTGATLEVDPEARSRTILWLPAADASTPIQELDRTATPVAPHTHDVRVLVVGEEARTARALGRVLRDRVLVVVADSVEDALDRWARERFDVLLAEISVTGPGVFGLMARRFPGEEGRVLFLAGSVFTAADKTFLEEHSDLVVRQPVERELLLERLLDVQRRFRSTEQRPVRWS